METSVTLFAATTEAAAHLQAIIKKHYPALDVQIVRGVKVSLTVASTDAALELRQFAFQVHQLDQLVPLRTFLEKAKVPPPPLPIKLSSGIFCLELGIRTMGPLLKAGITRLDQLLHMSVYDLRDTRGIGDDRCAAIQARLTEYGLELKKL